MMLYFNVLVILNIASNCKIVPMVMENAVNMPEKFKFGEDFDLFFRQFCTFAKIVKVGQAQYYNLIL